MSTGAAILIAGITLIVLLLGGLYIHSMLLAVGIVGHHRAGKKRSAVRPFELYHIYHGRNLFHDYHSAVCALRTADSGGWRCGGSIQHPLQHL